MKTTRREFLKFTGVGLAALTAPSLVLNCQKSKSKPNIIFIILDELGYYELSCMGNKKLKTPSIDKMAEEGIRFTQTLAGAPVCAPTRSCLMSGQHTGHTTIRANSGELALRDEDITIAEVLKQAGYVTGGFGKWGLGDRGTTGVPEKQGFDTFYGYYHQVHAHTYFPNYLIQNSKKIPLEGNTGDFYEGKQFAQTLIFEETKKFIAENKDHPFFCYCPWTPPHGLWGIPEDQPEWQDYKNKDWTAGQRTPNDAKIYAAMVAMIDRQIGEIFDLLKEYKIDENTIVFVCGDNGGQDYFKDGDPTKSKPDKPIFPGGFFGPNTNPVTGKRFRGGKRNLYEGGLRIPMVVRWPGKIQPGQVSDFLWYFPDILPTLAELVNTKSPKNIDGISIVPTLIREKNAGDKQQKHKYLYWEFLGQVAVRIDHWKGVRISDNQPFQLYNLLDDIGEKNNIAANYPDIVAKMEKYALEAHSENLKGTWLDKRKRFKGHQEN